MKWPPSPWLCHPDANHVDAPAHQAQRSWHGSDPKIYMKRQVAHTCGRRCKQRGPASARERWGSGTRQEPRPACRSALPCEPATAPSPLSRVWSAAAHQKSAQQQNDVEEEAEICGLSTVHPPSQQGALALTPSLSFAVDRGPQLLARLNASQGELKAAVARAGLAFASC